MFVDKNRGMAVVMGETDNKKALDVRKRNIAKEKTKYGKAAAEDPEYEELTLSWEAYYNKVNFFLKPKSSDTQYI